MPRQPPPSDFVQIGRVDRTSPTLNFNLLQRYNVIVKAKGRWSDNWVTVPFLTAISAVTRAFPSGSTAEFVFDFGRIRREGVKAMVGVDPFTDVLPLIIQRTGQSDGGVLVNLTADLYVEIVVSQTRSRGVFPVWVGVIPAENLAIEGSKAYGASSALRPSGQQRVTAFGLEYLLERRRVIGARAVFPGSTASPQTHSPITWSPAFNEQGRQGRQDFGNRSPSKVDNSTGGSALVSYAFAKFGDTASQWSNRDIMEYLLYWSDDHTSGNEPHFRLTPDEPTEEGEPPKRATIIEYLDTLHPTMKQEGRDVWSMLRELIDRRRGVSAGFRFSVDGKGDVEKGSASGDPSDGDIELAPFSMSDVRWVVGAAVVPANKNSIVVPIDSDIHIDAASVKITSENAYDLIIVQGERTQSCFSAASDQKATYQSGDPPTAIEEDDTLAEIRNIAAMHAAWSSADESSYNAASEEERRHERFNRVYRVFQLGNKSDGQFIWRTEGFLVEHNLNPDFDRDAIVRLQGANAPAWNSQSRILPRLPIPQAADTAAEAEQPRFLKPFVICELLDKDGRGIGKWVAAHNPAEAGSLGEATRETVSADVTPEDRALEMDIHFKPFQHALAANHFTGQALQKPAFDYERMIVTVAVETDTRPTVRMETHQASADRRRTLIISVPDVHVWLVAPGTIVGIGNANQPIPYNGPWLVDGNGDPIEGLVRDDTDRLARVAAAARSFYGRPRVTIEVTRHGLIDTNPIGQFIEAIMQNLNRQNIGSPVTERRWDFVEQTTTFRTGHAELDARLF